ncbi:MAG TPA: hypothetical protein VFW44_20850 [Bryobacteraceae bacterium]|nr:hypothetical protein [Bryobacteraceae bacterium]
MSYRRLAMVGLFATLLSAAADKKLPLEETSNTLLDISVAPPLDREQIKQELGGDLGADIVAIRVTARPITDKPVQLTLDDFLLISGKDGQRSEPYAPGQLAGSDTLAMTPNGQRHGLGDHHPTVGIGGFGLGAGNASPGSTPAPDFKAEESRDKEQNPLLAALTAKILPEKQITEPVTGLLFFQIVGKVKAKDLELRYKGPGGAMALRFKPEK